MRALPYLVAALGLAACSPQVPDSGAGVGFNDYNSYVRNAAPAPTPAMPIATAPSSAGGFSPQGAAAAIDRATGAAPVGATIPSTPAPMASTLAPAPMTSEPLAAQPLDATGQRPRGNAPAGIKEEMGEMAAVNPAISDEQDFKAVAARETIQSDKERIERNKAQYQVDQPTAVPQRSGDAGGSNLVQYALSTSHPVGSQMYKRGGLKFKSADAACGKYISADLAQEDFLNSGGPERDRKGLDSDGDGYACGWNPAPFRAALQ